MGATSEGRIVRGKQYTWPYGEEHHGNKVDLSVLPEPETASEIVYLHGFADRGWYRVENDQWQAGIQTEWNADELPYLWFWQEFGQTKTFSMNVMAYEMSPSGKSAK